MIFVVWLVVFGLGIYIHGLFSEQILEWAGILMIALGIGALALPAPYKTMQWLAASAFGLGMPLLITMLDRGQSKSAWTRARQSALWLAVVLAPPVLAHQWLKARDVPDGPMISLESFRQQPQAGTAIVALPAGTRIPLTVRIGGGAVAGSDDLTLPLTLAQPLEVAVVDGKTDGRYRTAGGPWRQRQYSMWIQHVEFAGALDPVAGPAASLKFDLTVDH
jgi:hypothetical protein